MRKWLVIKIKFVLLQAKQLLIINYILFSMKKTLLKWMMAMTLVATPLVFTGCGDDDSTDNGGSQTAVASKVDVVFSLPLNAEILQNCEATVTYVDAEGKSVVEDLAASNGLINNVWTKAVKGYQIPASMSFYIEIKAKDADAVGKTVVLPKKLDLSCQLTDANGKNVGDVVRQQMIVISGDESFKLSARQKARIAYAFMISQNGTINSSASHLQYVAFPVVSFEYQKLNDLGFWAGEENENVSDPWENGSKVYACEYHESYAKMNTTFGVTYWSGYAISNRTEKGFTMGDFTPTGMPDQFNNVTGKAHTGNCFCVVQPYGETIDLGAKAAKEGIELKGFWYTNSSYAVNAIVNGDGMSTVQGGFTKDDWFKCIVTGTKADNSTVTVEIMLAKDGDYVKDWRFADLSSMGKIKSLSFSFAGTKTNAYGLTTPAYICIDDIELPNE